MNTRFLTAIEEAFPEDLDTVRINLSELANILFRANQPCGENTVKRRAKFLINTKFAEATESMAILKDDSVININLKEIRKWIGLRKY